MKTEKGETVPTPTYPKFRAGFKFEEPTPKIPIKPKEEPLPEIPTRLKEETNMDAFDTFEEWYNSLTTADKALLTPLQEKAVRAYYGTL